MPHTLSIRKSNKYRAGWGYLDEWEDFGTFEVIARGEDTREPDEDDYCFAFCTHLIVDVQLDQPEPLEKTMQALRDYHSGSSCTHEYDCCGCISTWAAVQHINENRYHVLVSGSRNY